MNMFIKSTILKNAALSLILLILLLAFTALVSAEDRKPPETIRVKKIEVTFNGEPVTAQYSIIDVRTDEEKITDKKNGRLAGSAIIFFHGHTFRPNSGGNLLKNLAHVNSTSLI